MGEKLNGLLKTDDASKVTLNRSKIYNNAKRRIKRICKDLSKESKQYNPESTINIIRDYLRNEDKMDRILYSEISGYVFAMEMNDRGTFTTNVEKLLIFALDSDNSRVSDDCKKIIIKIYDHYQLALLQTKNIEETLISSVEETKTKLSSEMKGIEKEYISILGIFAAIVLAFVGGITFSSSVLQNISNVSIYRLLAIVLLLGFVLVNVIWLLVRFIAEINDKDIKIYNIKLFNILCIIFAILIMVAWVLDVHSMVEYLKALLPW